MVHWQRFVIVVLIGLLQPPQTWSQDTAREVFFERAAEGTPHKGKVLLAVQAHSDDIPLSARLMAVADVYDALISRRVYKPPFSQEKSIGILREGRGSHFDPDILDAFLAHTGEFQAIAERFADHDAEIDAAAAKQKAALGELAPE